MHKAPVLATDLAKGRPYPRQNDTWQNAKHCQRSRTKPATYPPPHLSTMQFGAHTLDPIPGCCAHASLCTFGRAEIPQQNCLCFAWDTIPHETVFWADVYIRYPAPLAPAPPMCRSMVPTNATSAFAWSCEEQRAKPAPEEIYVPTRKFPSTKKAVQAAPPLRWSRRGGDYGGDGGS